MSIETQLYTVAMIDHQQQFNYEYTSSAITSFFTIIGSVSLNDTVSFFMFAYIACVFRKKHSQTHTDHIHDSQATETHKKMKTIIIRRRDWNFFLGRQRKNYGHKDTKKSGIEGGYKCQVGVIITSYVCFSLVDFLFCFVLWLTFVFRFVFLLPV